MKKNMISVIILALLIVNIALTSVMLFSVTSTNKATADMVMRITGAMDMELSSADGNAFKPTVPIESTVPYDIADTMTIRLKQDGDGVDHYIMIAITLSMNNEHEDYKTYGESLSDRESLIKSEIINVVGQYTMAEAQADEEALKQAILESIQNMFGSDFIFRVDFRDVKYSG
ncbi:MAG: flagellar basal body-associated FliL family protein [Lachnospiraceae bacterium]|jgi:flagellar basal body-associated protein FliL|nr:flagellar basal body-associated FliL family protein [Lachnospiraceae bacterium]